MELVENMQNYGKKGSYRDVHFNSQVTIFLKHLKT